MSDGDLQQRLRRRTSGGDQQSSMHSLQRNNSDRPVTPSQSGVVDHTAIDMRQSDGTQAASDDTSNDDTYNPDRDTTIHQVNVLPSFLSSNNHAKQHTVNRQKHAQSVTADTEELQQNLQTRVDLVDKQSVNHYTKKPLTHIPFFSQLQLGRHTYKFRHSQFARNTEFAVRASLGFVIAAFLVYSTDIGATLNPGYLVIIIATLTQGPTLGQTVSIVQLIVYTLTPVVIFCYVVQLIGLGYEQYAATAVLIFVTSFYIGTRNSNVQSRKFGLLFPSIFFTTIIATPALPSTFAWTLYAAFLLGLVLSLATSLFVLPHFAFIELDSRFSYGVRSVAQLNALSLTAFCCTELAEAQAIMAEADIIQAYLRDNLTQMRVLAKVCDFEPLTFLRWSYLRHKTTTREYEITHFIDCLSSFMWHTNSQHISVIEVAYTDAHARLVEHIRPFMQKLEKVMLEAAYTATASRTDEQKLLKLLRQMHQTHDQLHERYARAILELQGLDIIATDKSDLASASTSPQPSPEPEHPTTGHVNPSHHVDMRHADSDSESETEAKEEPRLRHRNGLPDGRIGRNARKSTTKHANRYKHRSVLENSFFVFHVSELAKAFARNFDHRQLNPEERRKGSICDEQAPNNYTDESMEHGWTSEVHHTCKPLTSPYKQLLVDTVMYVPNTIKEYWQWLTWQNVKDYFLKPNVANLQTGLRSAILLELAAIFVLIPYLQVNFERGQWIMIAACMSQAENTSATFIQMRNRIIGTVFGAVYGGLVNSAVPNDVYLSFAMLWAWVFVCCYVMQNVSYSYAGRIGAATAVIVRLGSIPYANAPPQSNFATLRVQQNIIGVLLGSVVSIIVFPVLASDLLRANISDVMSSCATALETVYEVYRATIDKRRQMDTAYDKTADCYPAKSASVHPATADAESAGAKASPSFNAKVTHPATNGFTSSPNSKPSLNRQPSLPPLKRTLSEFEIVADANFGSFVNREITTIRSKLSMQPTLVMQAESEPRLWLRPVHPTSTVNKLTEAQYNLLRMIFSFDRALLRISQMQHLSNFDLGISFAVDVRRELMQLTDIVIQSLKLWSALVRNSILLPAAHQGTGRANLDDVDFDDKSQFSTQVEKPQIQRQGTGFKLVQRADTDSAASTDKTTGTDADKPAHRRQPTLMNRMKSVVTGDNGQPKPKVPSHRKHALNLIRMYHSAVELKVRHRDIAVKMIKNMQVNRSRAEQPTAATSLDCSDWSDKELMSVVQRSIVINSLFFASTHIVDAAMKLGSTVMTLLELEKATSYRPY